MQAGILTREMLTLDALYGDAPTYLCVLTTRTVTLDVRGFVERHKRWLKALRREFGVDVQCASTCEYQERGAPHWNRLLKGVGPGQEGRIERVTERVWCAGRDAEMAGQYVGEIGSAAAVTKYLASHFTKRRQWPPRGFRGQRSNQTPRYFGALTRSEMRETARVSLAAKRAMHRALTEGRSGVDAERRAREIVSDSAVDWQLVRKQGGGLVEVGSGRRDRVRSYVPERLSPSGALLGEVPWLGTLFDSIAVEPDARSRVR